ncbi:MAG: pH regulation protein F [Candidatus Bipolaricaulota bacterium]|nr:MAG: pH regulation protein F [Candidatus Bipolaricaulota bacterium]
MLAATEALVAASLVVVLVRLVIGPSLWDRLMAYNSASNRGIVIMAIFAVVTDKPLLLDVSIVYALLSYLGVVVLSRFLERGEIHR